VRYSEVPDPDGLHGKLSEGVSALQTAGGESPEQESGAEGKRVALGHLSTLSAF